MRLHHQPRVRRARLRIELGAVDDVAAVARQRRAVARFDVRRTRLRVLAGEAPDAHHRQAQPVHQHQAHLQQHLEPVADHVRRAFGEAFGAIAALQHEAPPFLRIRDLALQLEDFPRRHQRRQRAQFALHAGQRIGVGILRHCNAGRSRQLSGAQPCAAGSRDAGCAFGQAHRRLMLRCNASSAPWCQPQPRRNGTVQRRRKPASNATPQAR